MPDSPEMIGALSDGNARGSPESLPFGRFLSKRAGAFSGCWPVLFQTSMFVGLVSLASAIGLPQLAGEPAPPVVLPVTRRGSSFSDNPPIPPHVIGQFCVVRVSQQRTFPDRANRRQSYFAWNTTRPTAGAPAGKGIQGHVTCHVSFARAAHAPCSLSCPDSCTAPTNSN